MLNEKNRVGQLDEEENNTLYHAIQNTQTKLLVVFGPPPLEA